MRIVYIYNVIKYINVFMCLNIVYFKSYIKTLIKINSENAMASYNIEYIHFFIGM